MNSVVLAAASQPCDPSPARWHSSHSPHSQAVRLVNPTDQDLKTQMAFFEVVLHFCGISSLIWLTTGNMTEEELLRRELPRLAYATRLLKV